MTQSSIEARIAGLVADQKALFSGLFDGETNEVRFERSSPFLSRLERIIEPARAPEPAVTKPHRKGRPRPNERPTLSWRRRTRAELPPTTELGRAAGALSKDPAPEAERSPLPPASALRGWLSQVRVQRGDGGLAIEAPPEAADGLAARFEGMGRLLREAGRE